MSNFIYFTEEQKQRANSVDLVDFLEGQGEKLLRSGREKRLASDRSITVRGNRWFDHETREGGLAIDFLQNYYGLSFPEAVTRLLGEEGEIVYKTADINKQEERKPFVLPQKNSDMRRVFAYLIKQRHIARDIISFFAREKILYESCELSKDKTKEYYNAVFVGIDENGIPRHAHKQGICTKVKKFKGNIESSDPCYSFNYIGRSNKLYVFEAPIDMLSFITMYQKDWQYDSYVSLCGVSEQAMLKLIEVNPHLNHVMLCLDYDIAGIETSEKFYDILADRKIRCDKLMPEYKDWNEDLKASLNLPAISREEHPQYNLRDKICLEINELISELKDTDDSLLKLNKLFYKCKTSNSRQVVETLKQLSAFSLLLSEKEYRQMGSTKGVDTVQSKLYSGFKAYENRSRLNSRLDIIEQEILKVSKYEGILSKREKESIANSYESIAQHSLKAIILIELQELKQEQKQVKEMTMQ
ncbi:toprim domain-containing protein [Tissierella praeacuta]|uniref:toprim domain-containing protein n=1 Tax=Tissierella praeacuta TaxID=43131 RepID=UPI003DA483EF